MLRDDGFSIRRPPGPGVPEWVAVTRTPVPIGWVMSSFRPGGTEGQIIELIRRLDRDRWDVRVACLRSEGAWLERVATAAPCAMFPITRFRRSGIIRQLQSFVD